MRQQSLQKETAARSDIEGLNHSKVRLGMCPVSEPFESQQVALLKHYQSTTSAISCQILMVRPTLMSQGFASSSALTSLPWACLVSFSRAQSTFDAAGDQVENFLIRLSRASGVDGLATIPEMATMTTGVDLHPLDERLMFAGCNLNLMHWLSTASE